MPRGRDRGHLQTVMQCGGLARPNDERLAFTCTPGSSRHQLEFRLERDQEARGFATGHDAMVEGKRQRQHTPHRRLAPVRDGLRWIDVPDPRTRRSDKLQSTAQSD